MFEIIMNDDKVPRIEKSHYMSSWVRKKITFTYFIVKFKIIKEK